MGGTTTVTEVRSPDSAQRMATVGHPDRESLRELVLRKPQGPFGVPTDLAVRGAASLDDAVQDRALAVFGEWVWLLG